MSATTIELDLFGLDKGKSSKSQFQRLLDQPRNNVRDVQTAISKITNPHFLSTAAIVSGAPSLSLDGSFLTNDGFQKQQDHHHLVSPPNCALFSAKNMPVFIKPVSRAAPEIDPRTINAPLTIFYNGTVSVFNVPHDKAEMIMKLAEEEGRSKAPPAPAVAAEASSSSEQKLLEKLNGGGGDLPIARKRSLLRFLEKRKERLTTVSPYSSGKGSENVGEGGKSE